MVEVIRVRGGSPCSVCGERDASVSPTCASCNEVSEELCFTCAKGQCPRCGKGLTAKPAFQATLSGAIAAGDVDEVERLARQHRGELEEWRHGAPPTFAAARHPDRQKALAMCEALVEAGVPSDARDANGRTALMVMVRDRPNVHANVAEFFRSTINAQDEAGVTALMFAATGAGMFGSPKGSIKDAAMLIELGANVALTDKTGATALGWAERDNKKGTNADMVAFLQEEMLIAAALKIVRTQYKHAFDANGVLTLERKPT